MIDGKLVYSNAWTIGDARICFYIRSDGDTATYEVWQQDDAGEDYYCIYDGSDYTQAELNWDRAIDYARCDLIRKYHKVLNKASYKVESQLPSWHRDEEVLLCQNSRGDWIHKYKKVESQKEVQQCQN